MAQVTDRRIRETIYTDTENGVAVTVERRAVATPNAAAETEKADQHRSALMATLTDAVAKADTLANQLPDRVPTLLPIPIVLKPASASDAVTLVLSPAPARTDEPAPDIATLFTLLAGIIADESDQTIACELVADYEQIAFRVTVPADLATIVTQQLYATHPTLGIETLTNNTQRLPGALMAGATVAFHPDDAELRLPDTALSDPLHALVETFGQLSGSEALMCQLVMSPSEVAEPLVLRAARGVGGVLRDRLFPGTSSADNSDETPKASIARVTIRIAAAAATNERASQLVQTASAPFYQWISPNGAQLKRQTARKLPPFRRAMEARTPDTKDSFLVTASELASLYHLPANPRTFPRLTALSATELPPPSFVPHPAGLTLGESRYRHEKTPVVLAPTDRLRHLYLIGQTGTGKSSLFQSLFLQDIARGEGGCFIDPHGESIDWLLERIPKERLRDVVLFDPADSTTSLGLNLLEWRTSEERDLLIQELILLFYKLFDPDHTGIIGPQFEHWLRSAALTVTEPAIRGTLADIPRLFTDEAYQRWAVQRVTHPAAKRFWLEQMAQTSAFHRSEMLNYFTSKFGAFLGNATMARILTQTESAFDLRTVMDKRKILLVNLSKGKIGDLNAQLLGTILLTKLQVAALGRANVPTAERAPFYVYLDEFQTIATDSFATMLSEIRKYGVALHLTHQYVSQLSPALKDAVLGNVGTLLAFRLGHEDAEWLASYFHPLTADDLTHIRAYHVHCRTLNAGVTSAPFTIRAYHADVPAEPAAGAVTRARMQAASALLALRALPALPPTLQTGTDHMVVSG